MSPDAYFLFNKQYSLLEMKKRKTCHHGQIRQRRLSFAVDGANLEHRELPALPGALPPTQTGSADPLLGDVGGLGADSHTAGVLSGPPSLG